MTPNVQVGVTLVRFRPTTSFARATAIMACALAACRGDAPTRDGWALPTMVCTTLSESRRLAARRRLR